MRTYCRICEAACGLTVDTDGDGQPIALRPDRDHPVSRGYVCAKGTRFLDVAMHPDRLLHPVVDGARASWRDAIDAAADRIRRVVDRHGPHAVGMYYGNPMAFNAQGGLAMAAFSKALGTRNVYAAGSQDCNNKFAGAAIVHGSPVIHPVPDLARTDLAIMFGTNPFVSQSSFVHLEGGALVFKRIVERGGGVIWVDPRRTESAARCGEHLAIVPGTDVWLLLALLKLLGDDAVRHRHVSGLDEILEAAASVSLADAGERTGLGEVAIRGLAERIRRARSVAFHMSVGVNQSGFGTLAYVALQALAYVTGNFDRAGGSLVHPTAGLFARLSRRAGFEVTRTSRVGGVASVLGTMSGGVLADEILTPGDDRIRAMIVLAGDPVQSIPGAARLREAFASLDTLVCIDMFRNDTGAHADVLLPATSWLERFDVAMATIPFQTGRLVQASGPVMPARGEARNDARILADLAFALGHRGLGWRLARLDFDRWLPRPRYGFTGARVRPGSYLRRHRLRLWAPQLDGELARLCAEPPPGDGFYVICRRRKLGHNSWLQGGVRDGDPEAVAWMRADDMASIGVSDGDGIEIRSSAGALVIPVAAADGLAPRTVCVPHGVPGLNINDVIPGGIDAIERISGQLRMTGIAAEVEAVSSQQRRSAGG